MKKCLLALAAFATCAGPALAADLPARTYTKAPAVVAPVFSWTGCYIGADVDVGSAWARQDANNNNPAILSVSNQAADSVTLKGSGLIGGAFAGCNIEFNRWVFGIEGDWSGTRLADTQIGPNLLADGTPATSGFVSFTRSVDWLASIRGRLGYAVTPNVLLYATGGGAWANTHFSGLDVFAGGCPSCASFAYTSTKSGWVVGGGVEWAPWSDGWLIRAEYLHYDIQGSTSPIASASGSDEKAQYFFQRDRIDEVRVGMSYKFNWAGPVVAKY